MELIDRLADALQTLMDYQNGPPLCKYEKEWRKVMEDSIVLIKEYEKTTGRRVLNEEYL